MDSETQAVLTKQEKVRDFVKSDGWQEVKAILVEKLETMNSITTLDFTLPNTLLEAQTRANTVKLIYQWISEIEGTAQAYNDNKETLGSLQDEIIVKTS